MRKSTFSDGQIVAIVRESEAEGVTVEQVAKKHGITSTTLFRWRKRFGGLDPSQAAELRHLQAENARLKQVGERLRADPADQLVGRRGAAAEALARGDAQVGPHPLLRVVPRAVVVAEVAPAARHLERRVEGRDGRGRDRAERGLGARPLRRDPNRGRRFLRRPEN